jgi:Kef-type K+ transport system membrane component KefB
MPRLEISSLTVLLAQMGAVLLTAAALGWVVRWFGQPLVIAEVAAGIVLGPSVLGKVWPEGMAVLFADGSLPLLKVLSQLGLVLFMFLVGVDLDHQLLRGRTYSALAISHASIIVPFALGSAVAMGLFRTYALPQVSPIAFVLFMGTAMSITAFPVLARILSEARLTSSPIGVLALTCAAVDDVSAWCILAVVSAVARAQALTSAVWTCLWALIFTFTMVMAVRPLLRHGFKRLDVSKRLPRGVVTLTLLLLLTSAGVTEMIGMHALFGAFLFGSILPREGGLPKALKEKIETVAVVLLMPLFFAYSGLRTEIGLMSGPTEWAIAALLIGCASLGKVGGAAISGKLVGLPWREAGAIGVLMNTRGLMELVVLNLGMDLGIISPLAFSSLVVMALVTTAATAPLLRWLYPAEQHRRSDLIAGEPSMSAVVGSSG